MITSIALSDFFLANASKGVNNYAHPPRSGFAMQTLENFISQCDDTDILAGYRDGVILVHRPNPGWVLHDTVELVEGEELKASFTARVPGEEPRKAYEAIRNELPLAKSVFFVLYRSDVLNETEERSRDTEWEVVAAITSALDIPEPMAVETLLANHFKLSGGTQTNMSDTTFVQALEESVRFWKNRAKAVLKETTQL